MRTTTNTKADTTAADRYALDRTREGAELLARLGKLSSEDVRQSQELREREGASQAVLARYMGVIFEGVSGAPARRADDGGC